jgi:hypothetical protein
MKFRRGRKVRITCEANCMAPRALIISEVYGKNVPLILATAEKIHSSVPRSPLSMEYYISTSSRLIWLGVQSCGFVPACGTW